MVQRTSRHATRFAAVVLLALLTVSSYAANPFVGHWELTIPGGGAGWLGVEEKDGKLTSSLLWGGGSVVPTAETKVDGDKLIVTRVNRGRRGADGSPGPITSTETITATTPDGKALKLMTVTANAEGKAGQAREFTGKRTPPMPAKPDLAKVKFGEPIQLFNGKDIAGWRLLNPKDESAWSVKDGVLNNDPVKAAPGQPAKHYGNLRTEKEFEDFRLTTDVMVPKGGNSGIYLRGIYEIQVADTHGRGLDTHNMGCLYSRIAASEPAEKPAGEWQTMDITLVDRHVTVVLNGKKIIDNQPALGCTGGALWSDVSKPGPIYLQGDHTGVNYKNMVLYPVVK